MVVAAFVCSVGCDPPARGGEPHAQPGSGAQAGSTAVPVLDAPADTVAAAAVAVDAAASGSAAVAEAPVSLDAGPGSQAVVTGWQPRPGTSAMVRFDAKLDFDVNFGGMKTVTSTTQIKRKKIEILAVDRDGAVHKRITYLQRDTHMIVDDEERKDPSPVRGKAFLVTWRDGLSDIRQADGTPTTAEEDDAVRHEEVQLQVPELLGRALGGLRLVKGQPFEVPIVALSSLMTGAFRARRMVLTYRGKTRDGARLDAEGSLADEAQGTKKYVDLKAELVIDAGGWCRRAKVDAQVRFEFNGTVVGSGLGTGVVTATALR